ncbi:hypothetical protein [uncultured Bacteroides sp.]|uniref:hypothetical protein n=1 Tax=uncultured Bacteroides sp. TaxID=162156 RepID=UPI0025E40189|nr:hypothetical protein [uncultured Bacteroides sp.]
MKHILSFIFSFLLCCVIVSCNSGGNGYTDSSCDIAVLFDRAKAYEAEGDAENAMICYLSAIDMLKERQDTVQKVSAYTRLGDFHFRYGMYDKAVENHRECYNIARRMEDDKLLCESAARLGLDYMMLNQKDTAMYFINKYQQMSFAKGLQNIFKDDYGLYSLNTKEDDFSSIVNTVKADSLGSLKCREQLMSLEADFLHEKYLLRKEKAEMNMIVNISSVVFIIGVLSALSFFFYRGRRKAEDCLTDIKQESIDRKCYYENRESELYEQEKQLKWREHQLLSDTNISAVTIINRMKSAPSYMPVKTSDEWNCLFLFAETLYPGFSETLDYAGGLTERDREICCLTKLGFTTGQMAVFYGISPGSVTKAKFRIQKKIESAYAAGISPKTV